MTLDQAKPQGPTVVGLPPAFGVLLGRNDMYCAAAEKNNPAGNVGVVVASSNGGNTSREQQ
jgi:hypothetical protein